MILKSAPGFPYFHYFQKGVKPKLLIHSGTHGDEYEVIKIVRDCVEKYSAQLPDFIFVPQVSPSAVARKKRRNNNHLDINRVFFDGSKEPEVLANIAIMTGHRYDMVISFHQDNEFDKFYIYDTSTLLPCSLITPLKRHLQKLGLAMYNGYDDPRDPLLSYKVSDGYVYLPLKTTSRETGMVANWVITHGICNKMLEPEVPGRAPRREQVLIVETIFKEVIIKYFDNLRYQREYA